MKDRLKDRLTGLTPIGRADQALRKKLDLDEEHLEEYENVLRKYRRIKAVETVLRILLYASLITAFAATIGIAGLSILEQVASFIGTGLLLVMFVASTYFASIYRETLTLNREILVSASKRKEE